MVGRYLNVLNYMIIIFLICMKWKSFSLSDVLEIKKVVLVVDEFSED